MEREKSVELQRWDKRKQLTTEYFKESEVRGGESEEH